MTRISFVLLILSSLLFNCKTQTTEPKTKTEPEPDTTSHNFVWLVDTLGDIPYSVLEDVAIINDTLIWAVGDLKDPITHEQHYGAAIWNGKEWRLKMLIDPLWNIPSRPRGIWAFSEDNIWLVGGYIWQWNGEKMNILWPKERIIPAYSFSKVWAANKNSVFFVGWKGSAMHYDGQTLTVMDTGTDIDLTDVWGTSENDVWACGFIDNTGETIIIHYNGVKWSKFYEPEPDPVYAVDTTKISGPLVSIWTDSPKYIWAHTAAGLYWIDSKDPHNFIRHPEVASIPAWPTRIRGNHSKDIFVCGAFSTLWHYNGNDLMFYSQFYHIGKFYGLAIKGNLVVAVGEISALNKAYAVIGRRN